jgi:hypothetical protein
MGSSPKFHDESGNILAQEEDHSKEDYLAAKIVRELGSFLAGRANDLPHRFKAPNLFAEYLEDWAQTLAITPLNFTDLITPTP